MPLKMSYDKIIEGFNRSDLNHAQWTHQAHLVIAIYKVRTHIPENIIPVVRKKIMKLNDFHGTPNTDDFGYHETMTQFWLHTAFLFFTQNQGQNENQLIDQFISSEQGKKDHPLNFYSKKLLFSTDARHYYVHPDLKPLEIGKPEVIQYHGLLSDDEFISLFESCELDPVLFNHEGHLRLAWIYINHLGLHKAEEKVTSGIQNYVEHLGAKDKYHHTLTIAAVKTVYHFYQKYEGENFFNFIDEFPHLKEDFKSLIDAHYSPELIGSLSAKEQFIKPDLLEYS